MRRLVLGTRDLAVHVLHGRTAVLERASLLELFAERCGQCGEMSSLPTLLNHESRRRRSPVLVLLVRGTAALKDVRVEDVAGAVLLFQYRIFGLGTRLFAPYDGMGFGTVVAPEAERTRLALMAMRELLSRGAHVALLCCPGEQAQQTEVARQWQGLDLEWAQTSRMVGRSLRLESTFDATLAKLGQTTRSNLRYYRRRLLKRMSLEYFEDLRGKFTEEEFSELNAGSLNPCTVEESRERYRTACESPDGVLVGLRAENGQWLSLIGGFRRGTTTTLHWQMNAAGYEKDSLCTVMRSYFIEHEIERGAKMLTIDRGTQHSMSHAFEQEPVYDLVARRCTWQGALVHKLLGLALGSRHLPLKPNHLAQMLHKNDLHWEQIPSWQHEVVDANSGALVAA